jgi:uncharacterized membrane protein
MQTVRLYSKEDCHLCDEAKTILVTAATGVPFHVQVVDIKRNPALEKMFGERIPVLDFGEGTRLYWPFDLEDVLQVLNGTLLPGQVGAPSTQPTSRPALSGRTRGLVIFVDKLIYHFAKHWILVIGLFLGLYTFLPLLAPMLMASGFTGTSNVIYSAYRFTCHQLPSRSYFIFGHQMAFCHRDTAIYVSLFLAVILFGFVRHRLKPLSWKAYLAFIVPMAIDGITQLFGLRTSTWQMRTITGALFGIGSAWLAFPYLEEAFQDIRQSVNQQLHLEQADPGNPASS